MAGGGSLGTGNVTVANILVGPGNLYIADTGTALPTWTTGGALVDLDDDANWTTIGATQEGVEVAYSPDYGEVEVDQLKDAARLFNQGLTVTMNTNLAEATLENLLVAWGLPDDCLVVDGTTDTFSISVPSDEPVERKLVVVGTAPDAAGPLDRDRIYVAHRVISIDGSTHSLRRTEATVFPVSFRLLPDPTQSGQEYGQIIDQVPGA
jgi:hypothetical protein